MMPCSRKDPHPSFRAELGWPIMKRVRMDFQSRVMTSLRISQTLRVRGPILYAGAGASPEGPEPNFRAGRETDKVHDLNISDQFTPICPPCHIALFISRPPGAGVDKAGLPFPSAGPTSAHYGGYLDPIGLKSNCSSISPLVFKVRRQVTVTA